MPSYLCHLVDEKQFNLFCSVDDDGDSGRERHVDEWSNAYISERNGLKIKISRKRKHEEDANGSGDKTNGTNPLNTPLPKKVKCDVMSFDYFTGSMEENS